MKRPNTDIRVSFYLKKTSKNNTNRRAIYVNLKFRGEQKQFATKIYVNNPDDFIKGGLVGREHHDNQMKLTMITKKLEGYDGKLFSDINKVLDAYYGDDILDYPSTILEVYEYSMKHQSDHVNNTIRRKKSIVNSFERFIKSNPTSYSNFSVIKKAPRQMFRQHALEYIDWLKSINMKKSSIILYVSSLSSLFNLFRKNHLDRVPTLIENPFSSIIKPDTKEQRKKKALARAIDWEYIERIKELRHIRPQDIMHQHMALLQAYTGLSFIEFGKEDCLEIRKTIHGPALINKRVKNKKDYMVYLKEDIEQIVKKLQPIIFPPFVDNNIINLFIKDKTYKKYNRYLKNIEKEIGFEDPKPLTSHRLRHTFGMRCVNDLKIQIHIVARMMGDDQETIMNNYADLTPDNIILEQKQQTNLFEGVNKKTRNSNN